MTGHFLPFVIVWALLALVVLVMIFWRKAVASHEDDSLHVSQVGVAQEQISVSHKLDQIDKWGKLLTIVAVAYGLILAAVYFYQSWVASSSIGV